MSDRATTSYVGIDLAWKSVNRTGLAAVDEAGRLTASAAVRSDDEIAAWLAAHAPRPGVVAVDAPLVVPNATGQRVAENLIGRAYGRYGASAYPASRSNAMFDPPRAAVLAERFGWAVDPAVRPGPGRTSCIEVYPHPALVGLFLLPQRVLYKKGPDRATGFRQLLDLLERVPELELAGSDRWAELRRTVASPAPGDLDRIEDEIDAVLCAHLAWLWQRRPEQLHVYGDVTTGYIVAPPPPTHPAAVTAVRRRVATTTPGAVATPSAGTEVVEVRGTPPGAAGTPHGVRWHDAVVSATRARAVSAAGRRLALSVEFVVPAQQLDEGSLDRLLAATVAALSTLLGEPEGGAERIDRITAARRAAGPGDDVGARIELTAL